LNFFSDEIKNVGIVVTIMTAVLFGTGWTYEAVFLEQFYINSDELLPDTGQAIVYGFTVLFFKFFAHWSVLVVVGLIIGPGVLGGRQLLSKHPEWKERLYVNGAAITLAGFIPLFIGAWFVIVADLAKVEAKAISKTSLEKVQWLKLSHQVCEIKGRVIRYRDGKIAFYSISDGQTFIVPERNVEQIISNKVAKDEDKESLGCEN
jgi:hypothetical protein